MSKISVAMATYNGEKYIKRQLDSILNQTLKPDEVIIIDDKSSDGTVELIDKYITENKLTQWKLFVNEKNIGYKRNFYNALKKVTGEIVFLSDQDDEWHIDKIEIMMKLLKEKNEIKALSSAVNLIDGLSEKITQKTERNYYNSNFLYLDHIPQYIEYFDMVYIALHNVSPGCTMAIRKEIVDIFLRIYNFKLPHDWFINLIASAYGGCAYVNDALIDYRKHENNAIGASTSPIIGILNKNREIRIDDYISRNDSIKKVLNVININSYKELEQVMLLNDNMIDFYKKPNPIKLIKLRRNSLYFQLAKRKVQIWEILVSFGLDRIIIKLLEKHFET